MRGFASAGAAYNEGVRQSSSDILVFAHQDVYLPAAWDEGLAETVTRLSAEDPEWAMLGVWGLNSETKPTGYSYCTGLQKVLGAPFANPIPCISLDEALLVLRRGAGWSFDEDLPGFHLYGTDMCLAARGRGLKSYVISAFCIHNTSGLTSLPWPFWRAYFFMRRKWWAQLPVMTLCTRIERVPISFIKQSLMSFYLHRIRGDTVGRRVPDPCGLHEELIRSGKVPTPRLSRVLASSSRV